MREKTTTVPALVDPPRFISKKRGGSVNSEAQSDSTIIGTAEAEKAGGFVRAEGRVVGTGITGEVVQGQAGGCMIRFDPHLPPP